MTAIDSQPPNCPHHVTSPLPPSSTHNNIVTLGNVNASKPSAANKPHKIQNITLPAQNPSHAAAQPGTQPMPGRAWNTLFANNRRREYGLRLKKVEVCTPDKVYINIDELQIYEKTDRCLVGCFVGRFPGRQAVHNLSTPWKVKHKVEFYASGWIIFKFRYAKEMEEVLCAGPYFVYDRFLILKKMPKFFAFGATEMTQVPVWVKFSNLPACSG